MALQRNTFRACVTHSTCVVHWEVQQ